MVVVVVAVAGARQGDREERRPLECATAVVSSLAQPEAVDPEEGEAGTMAGGPAGRPARRAVGSGAQARRSGGRGRARARGRGRTP